ncbi:MAG: sigma-70 family RNA polymerase sigma factor [Spirochaetaceae bacterium]|nr:sigma-70 family RNA polymerase sigma factor [Spirochaetaceae bacterium]
MDHTDHTDQDLARSIRSGDKNAFVALVRRYERPLSALLRDRLGPREAVEDVLQETLMRAWSGLRVQEPKNVRTWLYQVARNRCSDHLRSRQRRERIVEPEELARTVNRMGVADARRRRSAEAVVDALEAVPEQERRALQAFYLDGMSIAEIAARHRCPPGTVKRRLSHGRDRVRRELGITRTRRGITMRVDNRTAAKLPFPDRRPEITVSRSTGQPFSIDLRELAWWFIVPGIGERVRWAEYEQTLDGSAPKLTEVNSMVARRPAIVHGRECVEIEVDEQAYGDRTGLVRLNHSQDEEYRRARVWGRLDDTAVQWVAYESTRKGDGTTELQTFLDESWEHNFGSLDRRIEDKDYLTERPDGTLERAPDTPRMFASGLFDVRIDEREFACMRVFEIEPVATEADTLVLAYLNREGRTVLFRRYNGNRWGKLAQPPHRTGGTEMTWEEDLPHAHRLAIDDVTFVHQWDYLTEEACGL